MKRLLLVFMVLAAPLWALDPSEKLADPALEARARALDFEIRCVKCQSEAIASSDAAWARDARRKLRELVAGGASHQEVKDWFQARYGDFVLMEPPKTGGNLILWAMGPALLVVGLGGAFFWVRRRRRAVGVPDALSDAETREIERILDR